MALANANLTPEAVESIIRRDPTYLAMAYLWLNLPERDGRSVTIQAKPLRPTQGCYSFFYLPHSPGNPAIIIQALHADGQGPISEEKSTGQVATFRAMILESSPGLLKVVVAPGPVNWNWQTVGILPD